ncbi:MAG: DUF5681 domain-containing protein [Rhizomicrobium sp.]
MHHETGYGKPPVATRFQKGRSGNPGGRPGPRRAVEKEFQAALESALLSGPAALYFGTAETRLDAFAQALVWAAASGDCGAARLLYELLPERGHRARFPARVRRLLEPVTA